jgi:transcriptional regulator GlxA family with amidase domain
MNLAYGLRALLLTMLYLIGGSCWSYGQTPTAKRFVCQPCDSVCDLATYDKAGVCPHCGMALVQTPKKVAILIFDRVQIIDYTGPYEMFGAAGFEVFTVAATKDPVKTTMGMVVVPKYSFADAPPADVVVIPGGSVDRVSEHQETLRFLKEASAHSEFTLSVCNGAFTLANTGLLDGLTATTTRGNIPRLAQRYPKIKVVRDRRYVDNGKIITAAGLSAGMDGALHVIEKMLGSEVAEKVAFAEEYAWTKAERTHPPAKP